MTTLTARRGHEDLQRLMGLMTGAEKHGPSATSTLDVIWVLYDRVLRVDPARVDDPARDRFLLSKGHGPMAFYAVLAAKGFLREEDLVSFGGFDSRLGHHPDRILAPGVEISSGSLGHGLPLAVGVALGLRARGLTGPRVVVLVGDAELDEGSNWEAVVAASRLGLDALTVVAVDNSSSTLRWPGGLARRFAGEGFRSVDVDGRDHDAIAAAFSDVRDGRPVAVVAAVDPKE